MPMKHATRKRLSAWMVGVLLCGQWLVSAYACAWPGQALRPPAEVASPQEPLSHCEGAVAAEIENPTLCKAHCEADRKAPAQAASQDVPAPALAGVVRVPLVVLDAGLVRATFSGVPCTGSPPGWPPLYLAHGVLRI